MPATSEAHQKLGPFELLRAVASDGPSIVYEAFSPALEHKVALRVVPAQVPKLSPGQREQVLARVMRAARLDHPNIVAVYDCGWDRDAAFVAMECVEGETLAEYIGRVGRLPPLQGLALAAQLLSALAHAHDSGVVHAAIDADQVLISRCGQLKVSGFGWAAEAVLGTADVCDAAPCTAPERALGEELDHRADLYSAAVLTYELLTGALPFRAHERGTTGEHRAPAWPADAVRPELPPGINAVFNRALAQDRDARYQSAAELSVALQQALGVPIWVRASLPGGAKRARIRPLRRIGLASAFVAAVVWAVGWAGGDPQDVGPRITATEATTTAAAHAPRDETPRLATSITAPPAVQPDAALAAGRTPPPAAVQKALEGRDPPPKAIPPDRTPRRAEKAHVAARSSAPAARSHDPDRAPARQGRRQPVQASPYASCRDEFAIARDMCAAYRCATAEFRKHPVCVRMHAEAYARNRLAEPREGP